MFSIDTELIYKFSSIINACNSNKEIYASVELNKLWNQIINSLHIAIGYFVVGNNLNDTFDLLPSDFPNLIATVSSHKTNTTYNLTINDITGKIKLYSYISNSYYLKNISDKQWNDLLNSMKKFDIAYHENSDFCKDVKSKYPYLFRSFKGTVFRMMRNYFIHITEKYDDCSLGQLEKEWDSNVFIDDVLDEGIDVFKTLYKFNHTLWKYANS
jgi:hypothetical protein